MIESHVRSVAFALEKAAPWIGVPDRGLVAACWTGAVIEAAAAWSRLEQPERPSPAHLAGIVMSFIMRGVGLAAHRD